MSEIRLGILGGGQLGSMLSVAAKKLNIKTLIYSDDQDAPAQNFCDEFMFGDYKDKNKINDFVKKVNIVTYEFENIPYENINSIGHQWIRRFALALSKETLGQIRGKFGGSVPIPGESVSLNSGDLLSQAKEEQQALRDELKTILDEMTYPKLIASDKEMTDNAKGIMQDVPNGIFVG